MSTDFIPIIVVHRLPDGRCHTALDNLGRLSYQHFALAINDIVRHVAEAFKVSEEEVWEWVEKERNYPTTNIIVEKPQ